MDTESALPTAPSHISLTDPSLFINRELSLLEFHRRVLAQARKPDVPVLERMRFLTIFSSIIDEFFEVRVAGLQQSVRLDLGLRGPDGLVPSEVLRRISQIAHDLVDEQYSMLNTVMLPALAREGIKVLKRTDCTPAQAGWVEQYFTEQVLPVLTPLGLDPAHPFPNVQNKGLNFIVSLNGDDAFGRDSGIAIVQVPRSLPRLIALPTELSEDPHVFVMISSIIHANVARLFPGMSVTRCAQFRVTRNSNLWVDEEETDDLLRALKMELPRRHYGHAVRLEVADNCDAHLAEFLLHHFGLSRADLYQVRGPVNLHRLSSLVSNVDRPDLKFPAFVGGRPERLEPKGDLFAEIQQGDLLLHHPFETFSPVLELLHQAADDPGVLAIKQTLYRTGAHSPVVDALLNAARSGKDVTVLVELRARFDEAANIRLATRLQEAGVNVVYGIVGYKAHAKVLMIVRRESNRLERYVHLGTGNYHAGTSKAYTDYSLLTCSAVIGEDIQRLFTQLTGLGEVEPMQQILQSPFTLYPKIIEKIDHARKLASTEGPQRSRQTIRAKMNSLTDPGVIQALYAASQAGVKIDLVIRGTCRLRPGIPGVSDNIHVRSILGRFLEHSRVYIFDTGNGTPEVWASSADWMERNLHHRVETCFPILNAPLRDRVIDDIKLYLRDNVAAWVLQPDGNYIQTRPPTPEGSVHAQTILLRQLAI